MGNNENVELNINKTHTFGQSVLLVEDSVDDAFITKIMWKRAKIINRLFVVKDGLEALDFLLKRGKHDKAPEVSLVLLDLSLPKVDGFDTLCNIRGNSVCRDVPVIILSGTEREDVVNRAYDLGSDGFLTKPLTLKSLESALHGFQRIVDFKLTTI